jgi:hypothetical protein
VLAIQIGGPLATLEQRQISQSGAGVDEKQKPWAEFWWTEDVGSIGGAIKPTMFSALKVAILAPDFN